MDKRFNEQALAFLKQLIEKQLPGELWQQIEAGWLSLFNRVLIKDATRFELPEKYKNQLPGSGGIQIGMFTYQIRLVTIAQMFHQGTDLSSDTGIT